jgi:hypothetical protein
MRRVYLFALTLAFCAAGAGATAYIDEGFEGPFPPGGWGVEKTVNAGWDLQEGGPWCNYAIGWASSTDGIVRWARMDTPTFDVAAGTTVEFRYDYDLGCNGYPAEHYARFSLYYVGPPAETLVQRDMLLAADWRTYSDYIVVTRAGSVAARFEIYVKNPSFHTSVYAWDIDNVLINDKRYHAVEPTSMGRVRAIYR